MATQVTHKFTDLSHTGDDRLPSHMLNLESFASYATPEQIAAHQVMVFIMCGGGLLGRMAAEQPADFYIDDRSGKLPYSAKKIEQAVAGLVLIAEAAGLNPRDMPKMPRWHSCWIF